jgi:hypothetical protein
MRRGMCAEKSLTVSALEKTKAIYIRLNPIKKESQKKYPLLVNVNTYPKIIYERRIVNSNGNPFSNIIYLSQLKIISFPKRLKYT